MKALSLGLLVMSIGALTAACDGDTSAPLVDATPLVDTPTSGCDPATVLPANYRPIPNVSTGTVTPSAGNYLIDATAGGITMAGDRPYIYVDLKTGTKVEVNDLDARTSMTWDIALKRSSLRMNGGDSGSGGRKVSVVQAASLAAVTVAPTSGYTADDFADESCMLVTLPAGEPRSAFGEWYNYEQGAHAVAPKDEVYVFERPDGSHTALKIKSYYYDEDMMPGGTPDRSAVYTVEWKQL